MDVKIELPIHKESEHYLSLLNQYTIIDDPIYRINGRCVIHMYPQEDTNDGSFGGQGFCDAFNCLLCVYDVENCTCYKTEGHDGVFVDVPAETRIFKDLSTMIIIDGGVRIGYFQRLEVRKNNTLA